jgi:hypothetical protein
MLPVCLTTQIQPLPGASLLWGKLVPGCCLDAGCLETHSGGSAAAARCAWKVPSSGYAYLGGRLKDGDEWASKPECRLPFLPARPGDFFPRGREI